MPFNVEMKTQNHHVVAAEGFHAIVRMNPRDRMVFCEIVQSTPEKLLEFQEWFYKEYGGKSMIEIDFGKLPVGFSASTHENVFYVERNKIQFNEIAQDSVVQEQLTKFNDGTYQLSTDYDDGEKLFEFKKKNAEFVTLQKIEQDIYSPEAETAKVRNEFVRHFTVMQGNAVVATLMVTIYGNTAYFADFIVDKNRCQQGFGRALAIKVNKALEDEFPNVQRGTFITGNFSSLYRDIFHAKPIDVPGWIPSFNPPGEKLLEAARSTEVSAPGPAFPPSPS